MFAYHNHYASWLGGTIVKLQPFLSDRFLVGKRALRMQNLNRRHGL